MTRPLRLYAWLELGIGVYAFAFPAILDGAPVTGGALTDLIPAVLFDPLAESVPALLPIAKLLLLGVAVAGLLGVRHHPRIILGYYAAILVAESMPGSEAAMLCGRLREHGSGSSVIVIGDDVAESFGTRRLTKRDNVILLAGDDHSAEESWRLAVAIGADQVATLPAASDWIIARMAPATSSGAAPSSASQSVPLTMPNGKKMASPMHE